METKPLRANLPAATLVLCLWLSSPQACWAQSEKYREHVFLPPTFVGTPLSTQIHAEAAYLAARGDLVESVAIARKMHAEAFAQEIESSLDYVDGVFRRRELIREWRAKENPNSLQREEKRQKDRRHRIEHQFQDVLQGNVTEMLNWLLVELSGPAMALQHVARQASATDSEPSQPTQMLVNDRFIGTENPLDDLGESYNITSTDTELIQFSDGRLTFSAADPQILQTHWPFALRASNFDTLRNEFRSTREKILQEIALKGHISFESGERLIKLVDDMLVTLGDAYPREKRRNRYHMHSYLAAKRYLRTLAVETHRTIQDGDRSICDRNVRFEGRNVSELIGHMDRMGLMFAPPVPGGDRVYRSLLSAMRSLYLKWGTSNSEADSAITVIDPSYE